MIQKTSYYKAAAFILIKYFNTFSLKTSIISEIYTTTSSTQRACFSVLSPLASHMILYDTLISLL